MKLSHPKIEGALQASKWLSHRALIDSIELESLFEALSPFFIYNVSELVALDKAEISHEDFLVKYVDYIASLKAGLVPDEAPLRPYFSAVFSVSNEAIYAMEAKEGKYIIKPKAPVVQLSLHHFVYSSEERRFHSMIHARNAVTWGLQFSYPQIYSNSKTLDIVEVYKNSDYPNTKLFKALAKWMRVHTTPTPFVIEGKPLNATFRLGKKTKQWIGNHPQLGQIKLKL